LRSFELHFVVGYTCRSVSLALKDFPQSSQGKTTSSLAAMEELEVGL